MREEFLSYRFAGLKKPDQILSDRTDIGWKCRKYVRWKQVHNAADDGKILKSFGDDLIESNRLDLSLYGRVSSILLNVQKWRLDKDALSIDPSSNEAWEYVRTLLQVVNSSPQVISHWLAERSSAIPESPIDIQITFYVQLLDQFLSKQNTGGYVPLTGPTVQFHESAELNRTIKEQFRSTYESVGLKVPAAVNSATLIKQIYEDFGFEGVSIKSLDLTPLPQAAAKNQVFIQYKTLDATKLLRVTSKHGNVFLELNENHPFIQHIWDMKDARQIFENFFKCYAMSVVDTVSLSSAVNTFTSYLETHLRREFFPKR